MVVIGVVALLVVGPEQLPGMARKAGLWVGKARRMLADVKADVDRELHLEEIRQSIRQGQEAGFRPVKALRDEVESLRQDVEEDFEAEIEDFEDSAPSTHRKTARSNPSAHQSPSSDFHVNAPSSATATHAPKQHDDPSSAIATPQSSQPSSLN